MGGSGDGKRRQNVLTTQRVWGRGGASGDSRPVCGRLGCFLAVTLLQT